MKKILSLISILFVLSSYAYAEKPSKIGANVNKVQQYVSEGVYYSSTTCAISNPSNVFITTGPATLYAVNVTSQGVGSSVRIYDGINSTDTARKVVEYLDSGALSTWHFNVSISSRLAVDVQGAVAPCLAIIYRER